MDMEKLKTGTTTVGVKTKNLVVLATDMQTSLGNLNYEQETQKIYKITENISCTTAGSVADAQVLIRFMQAHAKLFEIERKTKITAKSLSTYVANVLNSYRYYPYEVQFIFGGFVDRPEIFEIGPTGSILERTKFAVSGSGTVLAMSTLDSSYEDNMTEEKTIELAIRAVNSAKKRDIYTCGRSINVWAIDEKGTRTIDDGKVLSILARINKQ